MRRHRIWVPVLASSLLLGCATARLIASGDNRELRTRKDSASDRSPSPPKLLVIALDGVGRERLYDLLEQGRMPHLAALLNVAPDGSFPHAHFNERYLSTLPSTTMVAWATAFTGVGAGKHGLTGNEFFVRERQELAAPVPVSFSDHEVSVSIYTDGYANRLLEAPTVYEQMRKRDPNVLIWVGMHPLYKGADQLLTVDRSVLAGAFESFLASTLEEMVSDETSRAIYEELDSEVVESVQEELEDSDAVADVITVYLVGIDAYSHVSSQGPEKAQQAYLPEVIDPQMKDLHEMLANRNALADRYVVVTADHGHTEVLHDQKHALSTDEDTDPPGVLERAGFRVRPFKLTVDEKDFQAVLAYQGAMAYVYLADRSTCPNEGDACDWTVPPRYEEDVLAAAEAFYENNRTGDMVGELRGTLDLILTRNPRAHAKVDLPFSRYVGQGRLENIQNTERYPSLKERLRDLAVGRFGERAGDIVLLAHNGDRDVPSQRYYFSHVYHSWHGSPSRQDSEIPLIVSHPDASSRELERTTEAALGDAPFQQRLTPLLLRLRYGSAESGSTDDVISGPGRPSGTQSH